MTQSLVRCTWVGLNKPHYEKYHDEEWGVPVYEDRLHFEMLSLEGAQAGLNWETILKKREAYRTAFKDFDPVLVSEMSDAGLDHCLLNPSLIRHRQKIASIRKNAQIFLTIQAIFGSFNAYVWNFVDNQPQINHWENVSEVPTQTLESQSLSKDLRQRGMTFVGPTIMYAYLQACGLVNDHLSSCWKKIQF